MEELNEKFEIAYATEDRRKLRRAITKDDLWMYDYIWTGGFIDGCKPRNGEYDVKIVSKLKPMHEQVKELILKAKYETGGDKYIEMKKEFDQITSTTNIPMK